MRAVLTDRPVSPAELASTGVELLGLDLLANLRPDVVAEATALDMGVVSIWSHPAGCDGRDDALAATDIALTVRQPKGTAIYMPLTDPAYMAEAGRVLKARGFRVGEHSGGYYFIDGAGVTVIVPDFRVVSDDLGAWNYDGPWRTPEPAAVAPAGLVGGRKLVQTVVTTWEWQ